MRRDRKMIVFGLAGVAALALGACHANNTANTGAETTAPAANETAAAPTTSAPAENTTGATTNTTGATTSAPATSAPPSGQ